ncbi:hypothetical protein E7Z59_07565 [Robertkochia marina]|uniref:Peptidase S9A N-terminal domain-containing protein n=1 Tax=Robertkochia marina TaxID=1227945 RepID=A0A4S3LZK2_9FLAO|nr:hypothetical protein [Robertkochia marina]THD67511.1 hypothetical protein E7Z59_07565 [Robertkochia marina]TRZ44622.1 hypothetical protein D3A96_08385 [Robertkochia marina]
MKNFSLYFLAMLSFAIVYAQEPEAYENARQDEVANFHTDADPAVGQILAATTNGKFFYTRGCQRETPGKVLYRASESSEERVLFDPLLYKYDAFYHVDALYPNLDGTRLAIGLSADHLPYMEVLIVDLDGNQLDKEISGVSKYGVSWLPDGEHFLYHRLSGNLQNGEELYLNTKTWLHRVGEDPKKDRDYFSAKTAGEIDIAEAELPVAEYSETLKAVVGKVVLPGNKLKLFVKRGDPLQETPWEKLAKEEAEVTDVFITNRFIYYKSAKEAPNFKIMASNLRWPDFCNADVVVPEYKDQRIIDFTVNANGLYFVTKDDRNQLRLWFKERKSDTYNPTAGHHFKIIELPVAAKTIQLQENPGGADKLWINIIDDQEKHHRFNYTKSGKFIKETVNTNPQTAL